MLPCCAQGSRGTRAALGKKTSSYLIMRVQGTAPSLFLGDPCHGNSWSQAVRLPNPDRITTRILIPTRLFLPGFLPIFDALLKIVGNCGTARGGHLVRQMWALFPDGTQYFVFLVGWITTKPCFSGKTRTRYCVISQRFLLFPINSHVIPNLHDEDGIKEGR